MVSQLDVVSLLLKHCELENIPFGVLSVVKQDFDIVDLSGVTMAHLTVKTYGSMT